MIFILVLLNLIRFIGVDISPPGFYADEAAGATQVLCLTETGHDFYGNWLPFFAQGFPGAGLYTPFFLYGEALWTSIFGNSIAAFRTFSGLVTSVTVLFLFLLVRHKVNLRAAFYVAFIASILPWAFQFSRIAWDPPLAVMFLIIGLWIICTNRAVWLAGIFFAFASYSYPPVRVSVTLLVIFMPMMSLRKKGVLFASFALVSIPLIIQLSNPEFLVRSKQLAIWNHPELNPRPEMGIFGYAVLFYDQFASHFTGTFLFNEGDKNLRHSISGYGLLTWIEKFSLTIGLGYLLVLGLRNRLLKNQRKIFSSEEQLLLKIAFLGIIFGVIPSALTSDSVPHALRSLAVWPFYAILSGILIYRFGESTWSKATLVLTVAFGLLYFGSYLNFYFSKYPEQAKNYFKVNNFNGIDHAYKRISKDHLTCDQAKSELSLPIVPILNQEFEFGGGNDYLGNGWLRPESWGVWSTGYKSSLLFPVPKGEPKILSLNMRAFLTPLNPSQSITILVNNKVSKNFIFTDQEQHLIEIPLEKSVLSGDKIGVDIDVKSPVSPKKMGISDDDRLLGISLISGKFE